MRQNRNEISEPSGVVLPFPGAAQPSEALQQAMGAGFGLALRDAEAALYLARMFTRGEARAVAVRRSIETARKALAEMERALGAPDAGAASSVFDAVRIMIADQREYGALSTAEAAGAHWATDKIEALS